MNVFEVEAALNPSTARHERKSNGFDVQVATYARASSGGRNREASILM
jgi:hypothetical protein